MSPCTVCAQGKVHDLVYTTHVALTYICANTTSRHIKSSEAKLSSRQVDAGKYDFKDDSIELKAVRNDFDNKGF